MVWRIFRRKKAETDLPDRIEPPRKRVNGTDDGESAASVLRARLIVLLQNFSEWFQIKAQPVLRKVDWALLRTAAFILALSFVLASSVSTFAANMALNIVSGDAKKKNDDLPLGIGNANSARNNGPSPGELRKSILARNVFNSSGELAPEVDEGKSGLTKTKDLNFDAVPCTEEKLPVEIVGTIYIGDPKKSLVTMKDPKVPDTDTYKGGDLIIEHEEYEIYQVTRGSVELRKGDQKICIDLKGFEKNNKAAGGPQVPGAPAAVRPENVEVLEFDANYIAQEIGPGYSNILNSAKLIPEVEGGNKVIGFKIIAITPNSLFDKMKLQNGDVIADVNGVSLRDASQGFKLYQSLQEEREITVGIIRNGEPMTRKVRVK